MEDLLPPVATDTDQHSMFIERSWRMMEMCWTTGRRDGSSHFDGRGSNNDGRDEDEDEDKDEDEDEDEDEDKDEDEDEDEPPFYDSGIPGISTWDLLGKDFEPEAAALGLHSSCMNYLPS